MFLFDREIEKVDAFYTTKLGEIRNRIRTINRNIRKQDCLTPELEALGELLMCELNTSSPISDYSNHNEVAYSFYDEKDPLVLEQIEECRVWVLKLSQYASLNTEGFRKALKKFDKKHPKRGTSILESQYSLKVLSKGFAKYQSTLGHIEDFLLKSSSLVGHKLLSSQSPSDHSAQNEPIKEIRRVWEDIYKLQVRSVLESDDLAAFKSIIPSMQLKVSVSSLEAKADESKSCFDSIVIREHTLLIKYLLDSICAHQSVHCLSHVIESEGLPIEQIERLLNISLVDRVLTSLAPRDPVKEQKASQMIEMLLGSGSNLEWRDFRGRNLLHKAVLSSSPVCVTKILEKVGKDLLERPDYDGIFPLFLVIERNLSQICAMLLMALTDTGSRIQLLSMSNKVLHPIILASKLGYLDTLKVLLEYNAEIDAIDLDGETAVYHCSKRNAVECLELLLSKGANPNIAECYRLWTPIFAGAAAGFERCCSLLIKFGADLLHRDRDGWMAAEHSAFRGHMELLTMLRPHNGLEASGQSCFEPTAPTTPISEIETVKEYGHAFLEAGTQLRITFGHGYGDRAQFPAVELLTSPNIASNFLQLRVSVNNSSEMNDARIFDLPLRDYHESLSFNISNTEAIVLSPWVELRFDLLRHVGGELSGSVGRGSIMLQSLLDTSGQPKNKGSVQLTCAVLSRSTMEAVALVSFQALIATPFKHSNLKLSKIIPYHKSVGTKIIGHRGLGANSGLPHPQIGENTVLSFVMAASLGAEYVEFDVQLTKDKVPVLYHDFIVKETFLETPVCALRLQNFLDLRKSHQNQTLRSTTFDDSFARPRSQAVHPIADEMQKTLKKTPGMIETPFATLREAFRKVPKNIGFNIEVKYPTRDEYLEWGLQYSHEINEYCDKILEVVFDEAADRPLLLSSFHPEICLLLSLKQPTYPVFFLTEGGMSKLPSEPRANSIQAAIRFAKEFHFLGIVCHSTPLLQCPRIIKTVKENGLLLFTYGAQNNEIAAVQAQLKHGVDAVIVDSVARIRKGLTDLTI